MKRKGSTGYAVQHLRVLPSLTLARFSKTSYAEILPTENIILSLRQCPCYGKGVVLPTTLLDVRIQIPCRAWSPQSLLMEQEV